jgi:hypothetical protein
MNKYGKIDSIKDKAIVRIISIIKGRRSKEIKLAANLILSYILYKLYKNKVANKAKNSFI